MYGQGWRSGGNRFAQMHKGISLMRAIQLNTISHVRASLTVEEAAYVWLRHWEGTIQSIIAAELGTNNGRIADVLNEKTHQGSKAKAHAMRAG